jgi:hypothetical protein
VAEHHGKHQVRFYDPDGRERSKGIAKITEAKKFKAAMTADKDRGVWGDPGNAKAPFEVVAKAHIARKIKLRPRTAEKYESCLRCYLLPAFGRTPVGAIMRDSVQEWVSGLVRDGLAPETVRGHLPVMVAIMKRAAEDGRIAK